MISVFQPAAESHEIPEELQMISHRFRVGTIPFPCRLCSEGLQLFHSQAPADPTALGSGGDVSEAAKEGSKPEITGNGCLSFYPACFKHMDGSHRQTQLLRPQTHIPTSALANQGPVDPQDLEILGCIIPWSGSSMALGTSSFTQGVHSITYLL